MSHRSRSLRAQAEVMEQAEAVVRSWLAKEYSQEEKNKVFEVVQIEARRLLLSHLGELVEESFRVLESLDHIFEALLGDYFRDTLGRLH